MISAVPQPSAVAMRRDGAEELLPRLCRTYADQAY
jgi:hypothetical protein